MYLFPAVQSRGWETTAFIRLKNYYVRQSQYCQAFLGIERPETQGGLVIDR